MNPFESIRAGNLEAPPPMDPRDLEPPRSATAERLDEAKRADSRRAMQWFWLDVDGGYRYVALDALKSSHGALTADFAEAKGHGGYVGMGAGARIFLVTIGPRARVGFFRDWYVWDLGGEIGLHVPVGDVEPFVSLAGGYTALAKLPEVGGVKSPFAVRGGDLRLDGGVDFYPTSWFSLGGSMSWDVLFLSRPAVSEATLMQIQAGASADEQPRVATLGADASGIGTAVSVSLRMGLHY